MARTDAPAFRRLTDADLTGAVALSTEAGWNQTEGDWRLMLGFGQGIGVEAPDSRLVATAMTLPFGGRFAWIAMVLVTAAWRRRGLATDLLRRCMARAEDAGLIAGLDATEAGREVYRPLGFNDIYSLSRWRAERPQGEAVADNGIRPMTAADLDAVVVLDRAAFGADRSHLLDAFLRRADGRAFVAPRDGGIAGYVLTRDGRVADYLGPLVAEDTAVAEPLLQQALATTSRPALIDVADHHEDLRKQLESAGFTRERGYTRMLLGRSNPLDDPTRVFAIAGPEFG